MHNKGFSLIELLVAIAVLGVLVAIAIPGLTSFVNGARISSQTNDFIAALNLARSEAVKRNATVLMCPSSDGATCNTDSSWSAGWIVRLAPAASGTIIQVYSKLAGGNALTAGAGGEIGFLPSGQATGSANFNLCSSTTTGGQSRSITVSLVGRVQSVNPATAGACG